MARNKGKEMLEMVKLEDLIGKTLTEAKQIGDDEIVFVTNEGEKYKLFHEQECCEEVTIESVTGDLSNLVGKPILMAEEVTSDQNPPNANHETIKYQDYSRFTWTFYKFATIKGYVDIRWYGESNGYYSESVDFCKVSDGMTG